VRRQPQIPVDEAPASGRGHGSEAAPPLSSRALLGLGAWLLLAALALGTTLSAFALIEPDEARNAEVAREMAVSNGYLLPRLNGLPYLDKPALEAAADLRSAGDLAVSVAPHLTRDTQLLWVGAYAAGLSFYLGREVPLAGGDEVPAPAPAAGTTR